jgi:hypothetical protein
VSAFKRNTAEGREKFPAPISRWLKLFFARLLRHELLFLAGGHATGSCGLHTVKDAGGPPGTVAYSHCSFAVLVNRLCSILKLITAALFQLFTVVGVEVVKAATVKSALSFRVVR